jgi:hypothetical protein
MHALIHLLIILSCIVFVSSKDIVYPPSHQWKVSCQRFHFGNNSFFDVDYSSRPNINATKVTISYKKNTSCRNGCWFGTLETRGLGLISQYLTENQFRVASFYMYGEKTMTLLGSLNTPITNNSVNVDFWITIDLVEGLYSNRSQCYDLNNWSFYTSSFHPIRTASFTSQIVTLSLIIILSLFTLTMSRTVIVRRKLISGIIGNVSLIVGTVVFFVQTMVLFQYSRRMLMDFRETKSGNRFHTATVAITVICSQLPWVAYTFRVYRYFQIKIAYWLMFRYKKLSNIIRAKWIFIICFVLANVATHITVAVLILNNKKIGPIIFRISIIRWLALTIAFLPFLLEFMINIKKLVKKGIIFYFIGDDPLMYRLELIFISTIVVLAFVIPLIIRERVPFYAIIVDQIVILFDQLTLGNGLAAFVGLYRKLTLKHSTEIVEQGILEQELNNTKFRELFEQYSLSELSYENIEAWNQLSSYEETGFISFTEYEEFYKSFISSSAPMQLNLSSKTRKFCNDISNRQELSEDIELSQLHLLKQDIMNNLADTYSRFVNTTEYKLYARMRDTLKDEFNIDLTNQLLHN